MTGSRLISDDFPTKPSQTTDLRSVMRLGLQSWRFIAVFALACALGTAVVSLFVPDRYTATATTLPASSDVAAGGLLSMAEAMSGLEMIGLGGPNKSPAVLYPEILRSRRLGERVLSKRYLIANATGPQNLYEYFDQHNPDLALGKLREITAVTYDKKTGVVSVAVTTTKPQLSADIANTCVGLLDEFSKSERKTRAGLTRQFIEERMVEVSRDLATAEENLRDFRDNNLNYYNSTSPDLLMEHARLGREVEVKTQVYQTLAQERELAAINEKKETPAIQILDTARAPSIKS
ncbi:MAG: hypothetical protein JSW34_10455, partial [Candidatus Zixiibacteriota bacterium]